MRELDGVGAERELVASLRRQVEQLRQEGKVALRRTALLAEVGKLLATSPQPAEQTLERIAHLAVPTLADFCMVELLGEEGALQLVALAHRHEQKEALARRLRASHPPRQESSPVLEAIRTGEAVLRAEVVEADLRRTARDEAELAGLLELGPRSVLVVPLVGREKVLGAITLVHAESGRRFAEEELILADKLATRTALALENVRLYRELERAHREKAALLDSTAEGIYGLDLEGRCTFVNASAANLLGYERSELIGRDLHDQLHHHLPDGTPRSVDACPIARAGRLREAVTVEDDVLYRKDGVAIPVRYTAAPVAEEGRIKGVVVSFTEVTLQRQAEENARRLLQEQAAREAAEEARERLEASEAQLARHAEELARSNEELERFAYVASHDLQEPLRMVTSYVQLLQRRYGERLDDDARDFIGYAVEGAGRMQRLIEDLLAYSRVQTRGRSFETVEMESVLRRARSNLQIAIEESGAEVESSPLPTLQGDDVQLVQLLQNLLANAIKFRGTERPLVRIEAEREGERWHFVIRDNGIGIEPAYTDRIFVLFQRLHGRGDYPGTGIGLAICKKIVERHGGEIWVEERPGPGAAFHFTLQAAATKASER